MNEINLATLNKGLESGKDILTDEHWVRWLWKTNLQAPNSPRFNENHLLGLLLTRHKAMTSKNLMMIRLSDMSSSIMHSSCVVRDLTFKRFRNVLEDLQMHWAEYFNLDKFQEIVEAMFVKFGEFNLNEQEIDDEASFDPQNPLRLNDSTLRRNLVLFCIMFRHIDLDARSQLISNSPPCDLDIQNFHVQAGKDSFNEHAMLSDVPLASKIQYQLDFTGMYHSISQVLYFHYPNYARKPQLTLEEIRKGQSHLHCLSVAMQMYPHVQCIYEDEQVPAAWHWFLCTGGQIYLVSPEGNVLTSDNIWCLTRMLPDTN